MNQVLHIKSLKLLKFVKYIESKEIFCIKLYNKEERKYYDSSNMNKALNNKKFWKFMTEVYLGTLSDIYDEDFFKKIVNGYSGRGDVTHEFQKEDYRIIGVFPKSAFAYIMKF